MLVHQKGKNMSLQRVMRPHPLNPRLSCLETRHQGASCFVRSYFTNRLSQTLDTQFLTLAYLCTFKVMSDPSLKIVQHCQHQQRTTVHTQKHSMLIRRLKYSSSLTFQHRETGLGISVVQRSTNTWQTWYNSAYLGLTFHRVGSSVQV